MSLIKKIVYKKLTEAELGTFVNMRISQLTEEYESAGREVPKNVDLKQALFDHYHKHMADGTFVSWLAMDGDTIVGTSGMSFVEKPPYFTCPSGKLGLLSSMFTDPAYRRMGIAKELLDRVIGEARIYGCGSVHITASEMGVELYTSYGFKHNGNFMMYNL
ncbi:MAG: GNAT family N-acetyltransferase [Lachnospiraceae bacterium]|nr:GNAT family N-acetyltransferase [Lachnospiraceae bacterium]